MFGYNELTKSAINIFFDRKMLLNWKKMSKRVLYICSFSSFSWKFSYRLIPRKWKQFLCSENNKKALINFLKTEWEKDKYALKLKGKQLYFVNEERCYLFTSFDGKFVTACLVEDLYSSQEEADTRISTPNGRQQPYPKNSCS